MADKTIIVLEPTNKSAKKELPMASRPDNLEGKTIGVVWNRKAGGDVLLNRFVELLDERFHFAQVLKNTKIAASYGVVEDILNEFSAKCDFVITAIGD